jgi:hypothetical protein
MVLERARREPGLTAIAVNDRFLFNALAYYGRDDFADPSTPPLAAWLLTERPETQAEQVAPLTPANGARVLAVVVDGVYRDQMAADFAQVSAHERISVRLDRKRWRRAEMFIGERFAPRPRGPTPP